MGLHWADAGAGPIASAAKALLGAQRTDGGWAQLATLESDSYATGQSLYALHVTGALAATDNRFRNGVRFLLEANIEEEEHGD